MAVPTNTLFINSYSNGGDYRIAVTLSFDTPNGGVTPPGYTLDVVYYNPTTGVHTVAAGEPVNLHPLTGATQGMYRIIDRAFYDMFDITMVPGYNTELMLYDPKLVTTAILLKKDGVVVDTLGDPNGTLPILSEPGAIVRNKNFTSTNGSFLPTDWNQYPASEYPYLWKFWQEHHVPFGPTIVGNLVDHVFNEDALNATASVFGDGVTFAGTEGITFGGGKLTVAYDGPSESSDFLGILSQGAISVANGRISYNGVEIGSVDSSAKGEHGSNLVVNLNAAATTESVQSLLQSLSYRTISQNPAADRSIKVTVSDSFGTKSPVVSAKLTVTPVNDAPTVSGDFALETAEGGKIVLTASDLAASDVDDSAGGLTYTVSEEINGRVLVNGLDVPTFTQADLEAGKVSFEHNGTQSTSASFKISLADGGEDGVVPIEHAVNVTVLRVNHAPIGSDKTLPINEDTPHTFSAADFGFADPTDADAPNGLKAIIVDTLPGAGSLTLRDVAVSPGDVIQASDIGSLVYTPVAGKTGTGYASFQFRVQDNGGTALGGADTSAHSYVLTFNVASVNDAPSSENNSTTINEDGSYTFSLADFAFTDHNDDEANSLEAIIIGRLPDAGTLKLGSVAVTSGQSILKADIAGLVYEPAQDGNGDHYASFTFMVQDDGGTANNGRDTSGEHTFDIRVLPVNDAPVAADKTVRVDEDGSYTFSVADFGFTDPKDLIAPNGLAKVVLTEVPPGGRLTLFNNPVSAGEEIDVADLHGLVYAPPMNANGSSYASIKFKVQDNGGTDRGGIDLSADLKTISITVDPLNDTPNLVGLTEDIGAPDTTAAKPFGAVTIQDPDGNSGLFTATVTFDRADLGSVTRSTGFRANADGSYSITGSATLVQASLRNFTYTPTNNKMVPGETGTIKFTLKVSDGIDLTTKTADLTVTSINDKPNVMNEGPVQVTDGATVSTTVQTGVLSNDTDADRDTLVVQSVGFEGTAGTIGSPLTGKYGTLTLNADGSYTYVADQAAASDLYSNQSPTETFTYLVSDGHGGTTEGRLVIQVSGSREVADGVEITRRTVSNPDGSATQTVDIPVVTDASQDGLADIALVKTGSGQSLITAHLPTGVGLKATGSPAAKGIAGSITDLIYAIQQHTAAGSTDQQSMTGGVQSFLAGLPASENILVQTVELSGAATSGQPISLSGLASGSGLPSTALVVDASGLPSGTVLKIDDVDFVAVVGAVRVTGGNGSQTAWGDSASQWMVLGADDDTIHGGAGDDYVGSLGGNDHLYGDEGNDTVSGGIGNDYLDGGVGRDLLIGGTGNDTFIVDNIHDVVREARNEGTDTVYASTNYALTGYVENLVLTGDAILGYANGLNNVVRGNGESNKILARSGNDRVFGGAGNDRLEGESGHDRLHGETGNDGLYGGSGTDRLDGGAGNDRLSGSTGHDVLYGRDGNDYLHGSTGVDKLLGGSGSDTFAFRSIRDSAPTTYGRDVIYDFSRKQKDKIDLTAIDANLLAGGNQKFTFVGQKSFFSFHAGELRYEKVKGGVEVYGDVNGDGQADLQIFLKNVSSLAKSDFLL